MVDACFVHCHVFMPKLLFCCVETVVNNALNRRHVVVVIDRLWINSAATLNTAFSVTNVQNGKYTAFWYLQILCYLTHLQFTIEFVEFFFGGGGTTAEFERPWTFSIICVCATTFTVSIPPLNRCFRRSRVRITLIKPLLCLTEFFPSESNALSTQENQIFPLFCKFLTVASLK